MSFGLFFVEIANGFEGDFVRNIEEITDLAVSVGIDTIGMASYLFPGVGEVADVAVAPLQAYWIDKTYGSKELAAIGFAEEILPGTFDFIPTCTIAHILNYKKSRKPGNYDEDYKAEEPVQEPVEYSKKAPDPKESSI